MFFFLVQRVSHELNQLNQLYQSERVILHILQAEVQKTYKNIVSIILDRFYVNEIPAADINIFDETNYLNLMNIKFMKMSVTIFAKREMQCFNFVCNLQICCISGT